MSKTLAEALGWSLTGAGPFPFRGYFRAMGELIVAPTSLLLEPTGNQPARHPLDDYFDLAEEAAASTLSKAINARDLAETAYLLAVDRCRTFEATWSNDSQLILNLNLDIAKDLDWGKEVKIKPSVYFVPRDGLLLILSSSRYRSVFDEPLDRWLPTRD